MDTFLRLFKALGGVPFEGPKPLNPRVSGLWFSKSRKGFGFRVWGFGGG